MTRKGQPGRRDPDLELDGLLPDVCVSIPSSDWPILLLRCVPLDYYTSYIVVAAKGCRGRLMVRRCLSAKLF